LRPGFEGDIFGFAAWTAAGLKNPVFDLCQHSRGRNNFGGQSVPKKRAVFRVQLGVFGGAPILLDDTPRLVLDFFWLEGAFSPQRLETAGGQPLVLGHGIRASGRGDLAIRRVGKSCRSTTGLKRFPRGSFRDGIGLWGHRGPPPPSGAKASRFSARSKDPHPRWHSWLGSCVGRKKGDCRPRDRTQLEKNVVRKKKFPSIKPPAAATAIFGRSGRGGGGFGKAFQRSLFVPGVLRLGGRLGIGMPEGGGFFSRAPAFVSVPMAGKSFKKDGRRPVWGPPPIKLFRAPAHSRGDRKEIRSSRCAGSSVSLGWSVRDFSWAGKKAVRGAKTGTCGTCRGLSGSRRAGHSPGLFFAVGGPGARGGRKNIAAFELSPLGPRRGAGGLGGGWAFGPAGVLGGGEPPGGGPGPAKTPKRAIFPPADVGNFSQGAESLGLGGGIGQKDGWGMAAKPGPPFGQLLPPGAQPGPWDTDKPGGNLEKRRNSGLNGQGPKKLVLQGHGGTVIF